MKPPSNGLPDSAWDERQSARSAHMLQSRAWAQFQQSLGRTPAYDEGDGWSWIGFQIRGRGYSYLYLPYGPTVTPDSLQPALSSISSSAANLGVDFVRCEPVGVAQLEPSGMSLHKVQPVQPSRTLVLDLTLDEADLWKGVRSGHRNPINRAKRSDLEITISSDMGRIAAVVELLEQTAHDRNFRSHEPDYYVRMLEKLMPMGFAKIASARVEGRLVSAAIVFDWMGTRAYAHAGNAPEARKLSASPALVWRLMTDAKESGMNAFDLWGVAARDAAPDDPWAGFSDFKRGFGGEEITYAGAWELPVKATKYRLMTAARSLVRRVRR